MKTKQNLPETFSLDTLPGVTHIVCLDEVSSTQVVARELAQEGASDKTLVLAEAQTEGRGRQGNTWESARGGLYMTLLLRPEAGVRFLPELALLSGEVASESLAAVFGIKTMVKKPNDVLAWHPRKRKWLKIAGILTESASVTGSPDWLLLGMGVNILNKVSLPSAVCAKDLSKSPAGRGALLQDFFRRFWTRYSAWEYSSRSKS